MQTNQTVNGSLTFLAESAESAKLVLCGTLRRWLLSTPFLFLSNAIQYKYSNLKITIFQPYRLQRYLLLTPISMWHYNYNRTPLIYKSVTMPKTRHPKRSGSTSSGKSKKRVKRIAELHPVKTKLDSPQPSLSAKQRRMLMMPTTSTSPSRS